MVTCRYDRTADTYRLPDGDECRVDDYGDPTHHCTARRTCAQHIGPSELTCARCIGRTRRDIARIVTITPLAAAAVIETGSIDAGDALSLAGPHADVRDLSERRLFDLGHLDTALRLGRITEDQWTRARIAMPDDDDTDPSLLLPRWAMMLAEDWDLALPDRLTLIPAATWLDRQLARIAQDPEQDWALFAREIRTCRQRLEDLLALVGRTRRGATCPACIEEGHTPAPRLRLRFGHWCTDEACERLHYADDTGDEWTCPRDRAHRWTEEEYRLRVADVYADQTAAG